MQLCLAIVAVVVANDIDAVVPEHEHNLTKQEFEDDFKNGLFDGDNKTNGFEKLSESNPELGTNDDTDTDDDWMHDDDKANDVHNPANLGEYICKDYDAQKESPAQEGAVFASVADAKETFAESLDTLCSNPAENEDQILAAVQQLKNDLLKVNLPDSNMTQSVEEKALTAEVASLKDDEGESRQTAMGEYCQTLKRTGGQAQLLKTGQPILEKFKVAATEMDECMQCMCAKGEAACTLEPACMHGMEHMMAVGEDMSRAEGFVNTQTGELIESLGEKHHGAINAVIKHMAQKKARMHEKHGPDPTPEQFMQFFSARDLSPQSLMQTATDINKAPEDKALKDLDSEASLAEVDVGGRRRRRRRRRAPDVRRRRSGFNMVRTCQQLGAMDGVDFKGGVISCGFDCNGYEGSQEVSLDCVFAEMLKIELVVTFSPLRLRLKLKLCAPGVSDVVGEIQKFPPADRILGKLGLDGGCLLLGMGEIDFTFGTAMIQPGTSGKKTFHFGILKGELHARFQYRWSLTLPHRSSAADMGAVYNRRKENCKYFLYTGDRRRRGSSDDKDARCCNHRSVSSNYKVGSEFAELELVQGLHESDLAAQSPVNTLGGPTVQNAPKENQLQVSVGNRRRRRRSVICNYNPPATRYDYSEATLAEVGVGGSRRRRRRTYYPTISQPKMDKPWFGIRSQAKLRVWYFVGTKTVYSKNLYKNSWWA